MCGRYSLIADIGELQERFGFDGSELTHVPRYNVAPTQMALTVTNGSERRGSYMRWGLIPSWAKSASVGNRMINAPRRRSPKCSASALRYRDDGAWFWPMASTSGRGKAPAGGP